MSLTEDGIFTTPVQNGTRRTRWPFITAQAMDKYASITERDYVVQSPAYVPTSPDRSSVTNLLTYSEEFNNAIWTKADATAGTNTAANPMDGLTTADSLLEAATTAEHTFAQAGTITATAATFSACVKALGRDWCRLKITDSAAAVKTAFFNLSTGVVGTVDSGATSSIVRVAEGWYRCSLTFTAPASGAATCLIQPSTDGATVSYAGDTAKGLYLFAAQLQQASAATQYAVTTTPSRTISAPPTDGTQNGTTDPYADPFAFLCGEMIPEIWGGNAPYFQFTRPYARIPAQQVTYPGSRYFSLPEVPNEFDGLSSMAVTNYPLNSAAGLGYYNISASAIFLENNKQLYGPVITLGNKTIGRATAGTFTLTYGANTTAALNWNDSNATIAAAINGLASVIAAGLTASVTNSLSSTSGGTLTTTWTVASTLTAMTMNAGSLTLTTSANVTTQIPTSANQIIRIPDHYVATSHGLDTAQSLAVVRGNDSMMLFATANWGSIDANTLWLPTTTAVGDYKFVADYNREYVPGRIYLLRTRLTEDFYLPGVSAGITTASDIPITIGLQNPSDFINALLTLTGWQTYETEGPAIWLNGPIYRRGYTAINLSDIS